MFFAQDLRHRSASITDDVLSSDTDLGGYFRYLKEIKEPRLLERRDRARENFSVRSKLLGPGEEITPTSTTPPPAPAPQSPAPVPTPELPPAAITPAPATPIAVAAPVSPTPLVIRKKSPNVL